MTFDSDVLISIAEEYATAFRKGEKTAEVRRRRLHIPSGARVWLYTKVPLGRVNLVGRVEAIETAAPSFLWKQFGERTALTRKQFFDYVQGCDAASIILLKQVRLLRDQLTLQQLRRCQRGFQPPQFAKFLSRGSALQKALLTLE